MSFLSPSFYLCSQFESEGICLKTICRDRHQRPCRYWRRGECYRGETCAFSHRLLRNELKKCDKCGKGNINLYYCNFCGKNFCCECTKEQAHDEEFAKFTEKIGCDEIHDTIPKDDASPVNEIELEKKKEQNLNC